MSFLNETIHPRGLKYEEKGLNQDNPVRCLSHNSRISHNIRLHYHDSLEINLLRYIKGNVHMEERSFALSDTTLLIIPPGTLHSYQTKGSDHESSLFKVWHLNPEFFKYLDTEMINQLIRGIKGVIISGDAEEKLIEVLNILEKGNILEQNAAMLRLFTLVPEIMTEERIKSQRDDFLHKTISFLEQNYHRPLSLDETAAHLNLSKYHFSRKFQQRAKSLFSTYLTTLRLEKSLIYLHEGRSVETAAYESGFEDPSYYISKFRNFYGITPGRYKRELNTD
ncbi:MULTISPECIES: AraC family transcriptional regulator [unclassified Oceanispirochaeta]|uniref:AraC family transcriptional regulator n=1 Tax=unclassified Oceanispirochaeta TaxID=2635722 RepID=UPI000E09546F|nr:MULTISPECIES: AraC family transcriptional regulator [unclassified Oceanispirochaeta]MBF9017233.1 helix-turn-helix domain-containing protein [Oceanispirochaeta sp. M2]NPD73682.1 helix-turn-helix transcriptional regulator [Oceanispirochaeta sp. M1]RDG30610.1 AraC family transcriptional regulator [Oceanispirochaeta sp. M1]